MKNRILIVLLFCVGRIDCQTNLIKEADFDNYFLTYDCNYPYPCFLEDFIYIDSWYGLPNKTQTPFQIKNYGNLAVQQGLDTIIAGDTITTTCQDIILFPSKTYLLTFQYLLDYPQPKELGVTFMNQSIFNQTVTSMTKITYSKIFQALTQSNIICFEAPKSINKNKPSRGVMIDNVYLSQKLITQYIRFQYRENYDDSILKLSGNYSVNLTKINLLNETVVNIGNISASIIDIRVDMDGFLEINVDMSLLKTYLGIEIILPKYWYTTNLGEGINFVVVGMQNKTEHVVNTSEETFPQAEEENNIYESRVNLKLIEQWFAVVLELICTLKILTFAAYLFRFISFANISMLYLFLNIDFLNQDLRKAFEEFATIIIGMGPITIGYKLIFNNILDFPYIGSNDNSFIVGEIETQGSQFSVISLTVDVQKWCMEDFIILMLNFGKIGFFWYVARKIKQFQCLKKQSQQWNLSVFKISMLLEILSLPSLWMIAAVVSLAQTARIQNSNFSYKLNQSIMTQFFIIFIFLWFCLHQLLLKKEIKIPSDDDEIKNKNVSQNKNSNKKKEYVFDTFDRLQSVEILYYIIFSTLIGFQEPNLFFSVTTAYQIGVCYAIFKRRQKSITFVTTILRKLIQIIIHLSFLCLYIITEVNQSQPIQISLLNQLSDAVSNVVFYSFIGGCCYEAVLILGQLCYQLILAIIWVIKKFKKSHNNRVSNQFEPQKKSTLNYKQFKIEITNYDEADMSSVDNCAFGESIKKLPLKIKAKGWNTYKQNDKKFNLPKSSFRQDGKANKTSKHLNQTNITRIFPELDNSEKTDLEIIQAKTNKQMRNDQLN